MIDTIIIIIITITLISDDNVLILHLLEDNIDMCFWPFCAHNYAYDVGMQRVLIEEKLFELYQ